MKIIIGKLVAVAVLGLAWAMTLGTSYPTAGTPDVSAAPLEFQEHAAAQDPAEKLRAIMRAKKKRAMSTPARVAHASGSPENPDQPKAQLDPPGAEAAPASSTETDDLLARTLTASRRISAAAEAARLRSATEPDRAAPAEIASAATPSASATADDQ